MTVRLARIEKAAKRPAPVQGVLPMQEKQAEPAQAGSSKPRKAAPVPRGMALDLDDFAVFVARLVRACGGRGPCVFAAGRFASRVARMHYDGRSEGLGAVMGDAVALVREFWRDPEWMRDRFPAFTLPLMEDAPTHPRERPEDFGERLVETLFGKDAPAEAPAHTHAASGGAEVPPHVHTAAAAPSAPSPDSRRRRKVREARRSLDVLAECAGLPAAPRPAPSPCGSASSPSTSPRPAPTLTGTRTSARSSASTSAST